jgi:hypothetical protein
MKQNKTSFLAIVLAIIMSACLSNPSDRCVHFCYGNLYTDSIEHLPVVGDSLTFFVTNQEKPLTSLVTDSTGHWSFQFHQYSSYHNYIEYDGGKMSYDDKPRKMRVYWHDSIILDTFFYPRFFPGPSDRIDTLYYILYTK